MDTLVERVKLGCVDRMGDRFVGSLYGNCFSGTYEIVFITKFPRTVKLKNIENGWTKLVWLDDPQHNLKSVKEKPPVGGFDTNE